jgi:hypothetical protein
MDQLEMEQTIPRADGRSVPRTALSLKQIDRNLATMEEIGDDPKMKLLSRAFRQVLSEHVETLQSPKMQLLAEAMSRMVLESANHNSTQAADSKELQRSQKRANKRLALIIIFQVIACAVLALILNRISLPAKQDVTASANVSEAATKSAVELKASTEALQAAKESSRTEVRLLTDQATRTRAEIREMSESLTALSLSRRQAQEEIGRLQQLQQMFQFRLLEGKDSQVFVQVPEQAEPFQTPDGKKYIAVSPPQ